MRLKSRVLLALPLLVGITACSDDRTPVSASDDQTKSLLARSPESKYGKSEVDSNTRVVVDGLARALARELATAGARKRIVAALKASTSDDEHKLALAQLTAGLRGGASAALAVRVSKTVERQPRNFGKLDQELEIYLPVRSQREKYNGDDELLVAWQLQEDEAPVAYTPAGERVTLSLDQPPEQPTLVIVPREEADMDQVALDPGCENHAVVAGAVGTWACSPAAIRARDARVGPVSPAARVSTVGTPAGLVVPPPDDPPPPGGTMPAALYMESTFMWDLREPWILGTPEIVYLITTVPTFGNLNDTQVACLSEAPSPTSKFYLNQDNVQQTYPMNPYDVKATYLNDGQIQDMEAIAVSRGMATADVNVTVWENDRGSLCTLDKSNVLQDVLAAGQAIGSLYGLSKGFGTCADETLNPAKAATIRAGIKFFTKLTKVCGLLSVPGLVTTALQVFGGDDDWIGIGTVNPSGPVNGYSHWVSDRNGLMVGQYNLRPMSQ